MLSRPLERVHSLGVQLLLGLGAARVADGRLALLDANVLYRGHDIVLVHDFDHMGERARIDDVALTLYYMNSEPAPDLDMDRRRSLLRRLVDGYESGLEDRLTPAERFALPVALADSRCGRSAAGSRASMTRAPHVPMPRG